MPWPSRPADVAMLAIMWRQAVLDVFPEAKFREPVQASEIVAAEGRPSPPLPEDLKQLLLESNGVIGQTHVATVWTLDQIVKQNLHFWSDPMFTQLYMPFD